MMLETGSGQCHFVQALTDNRNRTVQEVRNLLSWQEEVSAKAAAWPGYSSLGVITATTETGCGGRTSGDDAGAEDVKVEGDVLEIYSADKFEAVRSD
jgi:transcriptional/translational regulatory protein YebC/TACO1